jgi:hypothetical protein
MGWPAATPGSSLSPIEQRQHANQAYPGKTGVKLTSVNILTNNGLDGTLPRGIDRLSLEGAALGAHAA